MLVGRAGCFSFLYKDELFVCGGQSNNKKLTKTIEKYNFQNDNWSLLDFKL